MNPQVGRHCQEAVTAPFSLEWRFTSASGVMRALHWPGDPTPVLLVHDIGEEFDLDSWGELPEIVNQAGYTVIAVDLPGHGLSDGEFSDSVGRAAIRVACQQALNLTGHTPAIVAAGGAVRLLDDAMLTAHPLRALVVFSPPNSPAPAGSFPKLAFVGAVDEQNRAAADHFLRTSRGWSLVSSFGTRVQGHGLLKTPHAQTIVSQMFAFLNDYRVPSNQGAERRDARDSSPH